MLINSGGINNGMFGMQLRGRCPISQTTRFTSKNLRSHQTWKMKSLMTTMMTKMFHHLTRAFVLSAVFLCVRSRTTM